MKRPIALLAVCAGSLGAYTYDYSQSPVIQDSVRWATNGSPTYTSSGVNFGGAGGSLISIPAMTGQYPDSYEVDTTLSLKSGGGTYIQFLRTNSSTVQTGSGTYLSIEIVVPTGWTSPGYAQLNVNQCVNGSVTQLAGTTVTASDAMVLRTILIGNWMDVYSNNTLLWAGAVSLTTGKPGIGGYGMPSGSSIASVELGPQDTVAPGPVSAQTVASSILPNSASLRWQGVLDDAAGVGLLGYIVYRNGAEVGEQKVPEFTDGTVTPSTSYSYQICSLDWHLNTACAAALSVTTPPAQAVDPRRVGVRATGAYWGGGGEQITSGANVWNWANILQGDVMRLNSIKSVTYNKYGPNSNSVLRYFLESLPSMRWVTDLPFLIGYGTRIPGVN
jgi:hypothetical protein